MATEQIYFYVLSTVLIASLLFITAMFIGQAESVSRHDVLDKVKDKLGLGE